MLKSHSALHAKVWWTPNAAVLGSSNASTNGLALEHETGSGWHEANVRIDDATTLNSISKWFEKLFNEGTASRKQISHGRKSFGRRVSALFSLV